MKNKSIDRKKKIRTYWKLTTIEKSKIKANAKPITFAIHTRQNCKRVWLSQH